MRVRVTRFFFLLYQCGLVRVGAGTRGQKKLIPANRPAPHGLDKIQPGPAKKHLKTGRGGSVRSGFSGFAGSCPALGRISIFPMQVRDKK
jgi:hypothetical protein